MRNRIVLWVALAVFCVLPARAASAAGDPASIVPQDALVYVELSQEATQSLLSMTAVPPAGGLVGLPFASPFGYVNQALGLPERTAEGAAPHLRVAALAVGEKGPLFVLTFDEDRWPALLLQAKTKRPDGLASLPEIEAAALARGPSLIVGPQRACEALARAGQPALASNAAFQAARAAAKPTADTAVWAYVAVPALVRLVGQEGNFEFAAFSRFSGLDRARYAVVTAGQTENSSILEARVPFEIQDAWLLRLIPQGGTDATLDVPAEAAAVLALNWTDGATFFGNLRDFLVEMNEATGDQSTRAGLTQVEAGMGMKLDELFAQIGSGAAVYLPQAAANSLMSLQDWTAVVRLKDAGAFEACLAKLATGMTGQAAMKTDYQGTAVSTLPTLPFCYTVLPDRMVVGGSPQAVKRYMDWQSGAARKTLQGLVGERRAGALMWADVGLLLSSYPAPQSGMKMVATVCREGESLRMRAAVEDLDKAQFGQQLMMAYPAIMAAMLMPALTSARVQARQASGRNNLHQIGLAIAMYAGDHDGTYPPNLQEVLRLGYLDSPNVFLDPMDAAPRPLEPGGPPCSYEYVGAIPGTVPAGVVTVYQRRGMNPNGRSLLHADMSVDQATEAQLHDPAGDPKTSLRASYEAVVKAFGDTLTDERKAELKKFYEVQG